MPPAAVRVHFFTLCLPWLGGGPHTAVHLPQEGPAVSGGGGRSHLTKETQRGKETCPSHADWHPAFLTPLGFSALPQEAWLHSGQRLLLGPRSVQVILNISVLRPLHGVLLLPSLDRWPGLAWQCFLPPFFWVEPWHTGCPPPPPGALALPRNRSLVWFCLLQTRLPGLSWDSLQTQARRGSRRVSAEASG